MSFMDQFDLANHPAFIRRVTAAAVKAAVSVGNEANDGTNLSIMRRALATNVLQGPTVWGTRFAYAMAQNVAISFESSDNDIEFTINSTWNAMAGAF